MLLSDACQGWVVYWRRLQEPQAPAWGSEGDNLQATPEIHRQPTRSEFATTCTSQAGGRRSTKVAPPPSVSSNFSVPEWAWAISRLVERPSPLPPARVVTKR